MSKAVNLPLLCFIILFATLAIAGVGGMMVVSLRQQIAASARRLQSSEGEVLRLERLSEELRAKIAMLESPEALKIVAERMGMQPASLSQYHLMDTESHVARNTTKSDSRAHTAKISSRDGHKTYVSAAR